MYDLCTLQELATCQHGQIFAKNNTILQAYINAK